MVEIGEGESAQACQWGRGGVGSDYGDHFNGGHARGPKTGDGKEGGACVISNNNTGAEYGVQ